MDKNNFLNQLRRVSLSSLFALGLIGLTGCETMKPKSLLAEAPTLVGNISVEPRGRNWQIQSMGESAGRRFMIRTFATSCDDRSGNLYFDGPPGHYEPMASVHMSGQRIEDQLFRRLCSAGVPLVDQAERSQPNSQNQQNSLSPQSRDIMMQHLLNQALPQRAPSSETRCQRVPYSRTGEVVCNTN
jgi:hypothetical protein